MIQWAEPERWSCNTSLGYNKKLHIQDRLHMLLWQHGVLQDALSHCICNYFGRLPRIHSGCAIQCEMFQYSTKQWKALSMQIENSSFFQTLYSIKAAGDNPTHFGHYKFSGLVWTEVVSYSILATCNTSKSGRKRHIFLRGQSHFSWFFSRREFFFPR